MSCRLFYNIDLQKYCLYFTAFIRIKSRLGVKFSTQPHIWQYLLEKNTV